MRLIWANRFFWTVSKNWFTKLESLRQCPFLTVYGHDANTSVILLKSSILFLKSRYFWVLNLYFLLVVVCKLYDIRIFKVNSRFIPNAHLSVIMGVAHISWSRFSESLLIPEPLLFVNEPCSSLFKRFNHISNVSTDVLKRFGSKEWFSHESNFTSGSTSLALNSSSYLWNSKFE